MENIKTLTDLWSDIYKYLVIKNSPKTRKKSKPIFWVSKWIDYTKLDEPKIDDFIEQVSFSINWIYVQWWYYTRIYKKWKIFRNLWSDHIFLTKEDCIDSLWKDFLNVYKSKRLDHYKNSKCSKQNQIIQLEQDIYYIRDIIEELEKNNME